jgi:hypothetical protein
MEDGGRGIQRKVAEAQRDTLKSDGGGDKSRKLKKTGIETANHANGKWKKSRNWAAGGGAGDGQDVTLPKNS